MNKFHDDQVALPFNIFSFSNRSQHLKIAGGNTYHLSKAFEQYFCVTLFLTVAGKIRFVQVFR